MFKNVFLLFSIDLISGIFNSLKRILVIFKNVFEDEIFILFDKRVVWGGYVEILRKVFKWYLVVM